MGEGAGESGGEVEGEEGFSGGGVAEEEGEGSEKMTRGQGDWVTR